MRTETIEVFHYDELSAEARDKARDWWRDSEAQSGDMFWAESVIDDAAEIASRLGITIDKSKGSNSSLAIYWCGFWSQGDGACFTGTWAARDMQSVGDFATNYPSTWVDDKQRLHWNKPNKELHRIHEELAEVAQQFASATANTTGNDRYMSQTTDVELDAGPPEDWKAGSDAWVTDTSEAETVVREAMADFAHWIYRALEREYEFVNSDEQVAESIRANEYEFTADGQFHS